MFLCVQYLFVKKEINKYTGLTLSWWPHLHYYLTVRAVIKQKTHTDYVFLFCFFNIEDSAMVQTTLKCKLRPLIQKEAACNYEKAQLNLPFEVHG